MEQETPKVLEWEKDDVKLQTIIIPQCCVEGWDSCPHVVGKPPKVKKQIAL